METSYSVYLHRTLPLVVVSVFLPSISCELSFSRGAIEIGMREMETVLEQFSIQHTAVVHFHLNSDTDGTERASVQFSFTYEQEPELVALMQQLKDALAELDSRA